MAKRHDHRRQEAWWLTWQPQVRALFASSASAQQPDCVPRQTAPAGPAQPARRPWSPTPTTRLVGSSKTANSDLVVEYPAAPFLAGLALGSSSRLPLVHGGTSLSCRSGSSSSAWRRRGNRVGRQGPQVRIVLLVHPRMVLLV